MIRRPPRSTRTDTLFPDATLFRSFEEVCRQVAKSTAQGIPEDRHRLVVATQRTSRAISGPYQEVLEWARKAATGAEFFSRLAEHGVSGPEMRKLAGTFRSTLVGAGVAADDGDTGLCLRRFLIMVFDLELCVPIAG